jgi:N-acetylmuramoyl-L-alanine amidase
MPIEHTVQLGDCLSSIARQYDFVDWKTIYNDDGNAALRGTRLNPNVLLPGDPVVVPDKGTKQAACQTDKRHTFTLLRKDTHLRIVLRDNDGRPLAGKKYNLAVGDSMFDASLGADGMVDQVIPADAVTGTLTVWSDDVDPDNSDVWTLNLGCLAPVEKLSGVQSRLNNLGFDCGAVDDINGPRTKAAVMAFQKSKGLEIDGIPGTQTQAALRQAHGC